MLHQCLSSATRPIAFFLGAGCPASIQDNQNKPLIPDIAGITRSIYDNLANDHALSLALTAASDNLKNDGNTNPTVEDLLTHIRSLNAVAGTDTVRGLTTDQLGNLDQAICKLIFDIANKELSSQNTPYHNMSIWANSIRRDNPIEIFTTNYDMLIEQSLEESRVPYFDGFSGARRPVFDSLSIDHDSPLPHWTRLWKLHGSINWYQNDDGDVFRGTVNEPHKRRVIHPSHLKYEDSRRMPYLAMLDRFREFLKETTAAIVFCGFSFSDDHINEIVAQALQHTPTMVVFALQYGDIKDYPKAVELAENHTNLSILARNGAVIGSRRGLWLNQTRGTTLPISEFEVKWVATDPQDLESPMRPELVLGDFKVLGGFLRTLVDGSAHSSVRTPDVT